MTPQEAIDFIDNEVQIDVRYCSIQQIDKTREVFAFAKEALEKQIPKKPDTLTYRPLLNSGWKYQCPNCGCAVGKNKNVEFAYEEYLEAYQSNCMNCGQALDWSDTQ